MICFLRRFCLRALEPCIIGIEFVREDAVSMAVTISNTLSAGRLTVVWGIVLTRQDGEFRRRHMAVERSPADLWMS